MANDNFALGLGVVAGLGYLFTRMKDEKQTHDAEMIYRKYKGRKGPALSATSVKRGTRRRGNDGNMWEVRKSGKSQRWFKGAESFEAEDLTYSILDNGGYPFLVKVSKNNVEIYQEVRDSDGGWNYTKLIKKYKPLKTFIGKSLLNPTTKFSGAYGAEFDGNSILLKIGTDKYVYIGSIIFEFSTDGDEIVKYYSPVGNSGVPYPFAYGKKNVYLMERTYRTGKEKGGRYFSYKNAPTHQNKKSTDLDWEHYFGLDEQYYKNMKNVKSIYSQMDRMGGFDAESFEAEEKICKDCGETYEDCDMFLNPDCERLEGVELSHEDKATRIYEGIQQNINNPETVRHYYELFYGEPPAKDYEGDMALDVMEAVEQNLGGEAFVNYMYGEMYNAESFEAEWDFGDDRESLRKGEEHSDFNNAWRWIFKTKRREWPKWGQKFYDKYEWTLDDPHWNPQLDAESFEASERGNLYWCDDCGKYMGCESYGEWPSNMIITETEQELCGACYKKTQNAESFSAEGHVCERCGGEVRSEESYGLPDDEEAIKAVKEGKAGECIECGYFMYFDAESFDAEDCKNVKAFVEYTCVKCDGERGFFEVEDGNFYRFAPDIGDCSCGEFEIYSNEFISCEECESAFWHRGDGWAEHLRIIMDRKDAESFEAEVMSWDEMKNHKMTYNQMHNVIQSLKVGDTVSIISHDMWGSHSEWVSQEKVVIRVNDGIGIKADGNIITLQGGIRLTPEKYGTFLQKRTVSYQPLMAEVRNLRATHIVAIKKMSKWAIPYTSYRAESFGAEGMNLEEYEKMSWKTPSDELEDAVENLLAEVKRLQSEDEKILCVIPNNRGRSLFVGNKEKIRRNFINMWRGMEPGDELMQGEPPYPNPDYWPLVGKDKEVYEELLNQWEINWYNWVNENFTLEELAAMVDYRIEYLNPDENFLSVMGTKIEANIW